jgi:hypothetical protein
VNGSGVIDETEDGTVLFDISGSKTWGQSHTWGESIESLLDVGLDGFLLLG